MQFFPRTKSDNCSAHSGVAFSKLPSASQTSKYSIINWRLCKLVNFHAASIISAILYLFAIGIIFLRSSSFGACKDIARFIGRPHSISLYIPGTIPHVETVIRRQPIPISPLARSINPITFWTFCNGSPVPIITICDTSSLFASPFACMDFSENLSLRSSHCATSICAKISFTVKLRLRPSNVLAQNLHPIAHPACELTQTLFP